MNVKIYGSGGENNERLMGTAHDPQTALSLIYLLEKEDSSGCVLHGCLRPDEPASHWRLSLSAARRQFESMLGPQVWIVSIHTGEYEDAQSQMLKAFTDKTKAEAFRDELKGELRVRGLDTPSTERERDDSMFHGMRVDYTGAIVSVARFRC